jgi:hypothetical protein
MDRSSLTPHKRFEQTAKTNAFEIMSGHKSQAVLDLGLIKDVEALKNHIRTLESQNRLLV